MEISSLQVCEDLLTCLKRFKTELLRFADTYHMTPVQLYALYTMHRQTADTMGRLATVLQCDASNVTGIIDRLVAHGLVVRQEDENDRRTRTLHLTAKGESLVEKITAGLPDQLGCSKLSADERAKLHDILTKLVVVQ